MIYQTVILAVLLSIFLTPSVDGILCFQCNSVNNSQCVNLEHYAKGRFIVPQPCQVIENENEPFCRKTVLTILDKTKQIDTRVIRSCGYIKYKRECYKTDNDGHQEKVCQCFDDSCNSSPSLHSYIVLTIVSFTLCLILSP
ncbi:uncharacterized protein LOC143914509 [Arctopsyche grandis]|uniref:uncharacterized protein LOC143914509 n=1 Tax=Arctopsyche grandis TaxID=121162 RepID=UPI00406D86C9